MKSINSFFKEVKNELSKIVWPTKDEFFGSGDNGVDSEHISPGPPSVSSSISSSVSSEPDAPSASRHKTPKSCIVDHKPKSGCPQS